MSESVEESRERAREDLARSVVRLEDELERLVKLVAMAREAVETEMHDGMGYKRLSITEKDLRKLKDLTVTFNSAVDCKIRYDKAKKHLAGLMTPEEEMAAVITYIVTLPVERRTDLRDRLDRKGVFKYASSCEA